MLLDYIGSCIPYYATVFAVDYIQLYFGLHHSYAPNLPIMDPKSIHNLMGIIEYAYERESFSIRRAIWLFAVNVI